MQVANLYDNGPISPICQIKEHLAILTDTKWTPFLVEFIEPIPRSSAYIVDMLQVPPAVLLLAANGVVNAALVQVLQVSANEFVHLRWFPIDDIEGQLWELSNMARFSPRGGQAGVNLFTPLYDPWLATTTFWIIGGQGDKDVNVGCTNLTGGALAMARLGFFGYRYILKPESTIHANARYVPAMGR